MRRPCPESSGGRKVEEKRAARVCWRSRERPPDGRLWPHQRGSWWLRFALLSQNATSREAVGCMAYTVPR